VFDEHLYAAAARRLREATRPQFLILFTTTNHPPHELPANATPLPLVPPPALLARIETLTPVQRKQFRTYQYACDQFGGFLDGLEIDGLLERTLVSATGDHTIGTGIPFSGSEVVLERAVPFFLLPPPALKAQFAPDFARPGSHKDVVPTLLHLSGVAGSGYRGIGCSLLDEAAEGFAYNPGGLYLSREAVVLEFEGGNGAMGWSDPIGTSVRTVTETAMHATLLRRARAALALTDWIVHETVTSEP
jgi:phosphoglycerol transferase MdoB-like AlkP superfamily enzyme